MRSRPRAAELRRVARSGRRCGAGRPESPPVEPGGCERRRLRGSPERHRGVRRERLRTDSLRRALTGSQGFDEFAFGTPAIAYGHVYVGVGNVLHAYKASGCGQPSCSPDWVAMAPGSQAAILSSPAVANGVVFVGENSIEGLRSGR